MPQKFHHSPEDLRFHSFGSASDPLSELIQTNQVRYLRCYFADLGATSVLEEPSYFDRDYLAEFSAFYSTSSVGYRNICRRIHLFKGDPVTRERVIEAASGNEATVDSFNDSYLGFIVIRPIPAAQLGRTVVRWYDERFPSTPRITGPSREYKINIAGFCLKVTGLAWQQQDTGVGACATIALWTMLHSSAFDDHHAIPTTADITRSAHKSASLGARIFPSVGLTIPQICEAIKEHNLAPLILEGDVRDRHWNPIGFSRERFASSCAAFVRSGYPILLIGSFTDSDEGPSGHAMCVVGFRSGAPAPIKPGEVSLQESNIEHVYVHDDNIGPSVRFKVASMRTSGLIRRQHVAVIKPDAPPPTTSRQKLQCETSDYPAFCPTHLVVAAHNDLRTSPDRLHAAGVTTASYFSSALMSLAKATKTPGFGITVSTRFIKLAKYVDKELENILKSDPSRLSRVRLALWEKVPPMSLHIGVVRLGLDDTTPLVDILYDTTDSDRNHPVFAHIAYQGWVSSLMSLLTKAGRGDFGVSVEAF
ncbi:MAG: hypothetical protein NUV55_11790 [Sulfuricaulis sp.]|uniref:hypothetical protein n=1 Tax=Sulfuricaulis sp. TaxID=2003553 RepID=UPI0025DCD6D8|nr:hypothetical protein [Sulfuricaulis sp.]MCR4347867.1 hypothetical protein [Sulfuricaulis sp.]